MMASLDPFTCLNFNLIIFHPTIYFIQKIYTWRMKSMCTSCSRFYLNILNLVYWVLNFIKYLTLPVIITHNKVRSHWLVGIINKIVKGNYHIAVFNFFPNFQLVCNYILFLFLISFRQSRLHAVRTINTTRWRRINGLEP